MRIGGAEKARVMEALEAALLRGNGLVNVFLLEVEAVGAARRDLRGSSIDGLSRQAVPTVNDVWRYSSTLHCASCNITYSDPHPSSFSLTIRSALATPVAASVG